MQHKGIIKFFAIVFAIVCAFQLSFTIKSSLEDKKMREYVNNVQALDVAKELSDGDLGKESFLRDSISRARERFYVDSIENEVVYNIWLRKYTYKEVKERELNLGLDLRGGMNVIMEVSVIDVIRSLSGYNTDTTFNKAIDLAILRQKSSNENFVSLFGKAFQELAPDAKLASIFSTMELKDKIPFNATNDEVLKVIRSESDGAIATSYNILRSRIDRFGVAQPNIQELQTPGRILIELPGVKDPERVRKLLQGTARLEFWETYSFADPEILNAFEEANRRLRDMYALQQETKPEEETALAEKEVPQTNIEPPVASEEPTTDEDSPLLAVEDEASILEQAVDSIEQEKPEYTFEQYAKDNPLYAYLQPATYVNEQGQTMVNPSATIGYAHIKDTARVNSMLRSVSNLFPRNLKLMWTVKPERKGSNILSLVAIKATTRDGSPRLTGEVITNARQDVNHVTGSPEVSMSMNVEGARIWKQMTHENIGRQIAIVLDGYVYSYPNVNQEISGGQSSISGGSMTIEEAQDLANILKAGKLPAPARIIQEAVVGPSLGQEAINSGMWSFLLAFAMVLIYMVFFYSRAGLTACVALIVNLFFIFGVLTSFGAALTLPGIAGVILTLAMAIDANVIIYERVREELLAGKGLRLAIQDGYKHAYSAIIDSNVTTLLVAIILFAFGSGPVQGFATTLIIGVLTSLFTSIFITRLIFESSLNKNKKITFDTSITHTWFTNNRFQFVKNRRITYITSASLILISIISLSTLGLNYGIDFRGGRSYVVRFDQPVSVPEVRSALSEVFDKHPEVKTFGPSTQIKITTDYKYDDNNVDVDAEVENKLYIALKPFYTEEVGINEEAFSSNATTGGGNKYLGILSSEKVGATIAYDMKINALLAIFFSLLVIFGYIAIRFRKWQYGLAGVITLVHDTLVTIGMVSLFYSIMPFNMEADQAFIAAILTVISYSINSVVIIFDRVRENVREHPKRILSTNINDAINSTLGRTVNTSASTMIVLLMVFILGGESLRGFIFALLVGVAAGVYSSVFNAGSLAHDMIAGKKKEEVAVEKVKK
ncbi:MAG: protein translocase subunit SecDF [Bacteroidales bacterium]|nr:protein translocase subunit SecDF [Bacteroidales bacterium]